MYTGRLLTVCSGVIQRGGGVLGRRARWWEPLMVCSSSTSDRRGFDKSVLLVRHNEESRRQPTNTPTGHERAIQTRVS